MPSCMEEVVQIGGDNFGYAPNPESPQSREESLQGKFNRSPDLQPKGLQDFPGLNSSGFMDLGRSGFLCWGFGVDKTCVPLGVLGS